MVQWFWDDLQNTCPVIKTPIHSKWNCENSREKLYKNSQEKIWNTANKNWMNVVYWDNFGLVSWTNSKWKCLQKYHVFPHRKDIEYLLVFVLVKSPFDEAQMVCCQCILKKVLLGCVNFCSHFATFLSATMARLAMNYKLVWAKKWFPEAVRIINGKLFSLAFSLSMGSGGEYLRFYLFWWRYDYRSLNNKPIYHLTISGDVSLLFNN